VISRKFIAVAASAGVLAFGISACGGDDDDSTSGDGGEALSGTVVIDGSSTVAPLSEPAGELFNQENPDVQVTVGTSGTGGGFEKFCVGETDISDASRAIEAEEEELCAENGVEYEEIVVANDALSVVVNPENPVDCLTVDQVNAIYDPKSTITNWNEVDGIDYDQELEIYRTRARSTTSPRRSTVRRAPSAPRT
jgi:phosphate transport system substrate-binding protein